MSRVFPYSSQMDFIKVKDFNEISDNYDRSIFFVQCSMESMVELIKQDAFIRRRVHMNFL